MKPDNAIWWIKLKAKQEKKYDSEPIFSGGTLPLTVIKAKKPSRETMGKNVRIGIDRGEIDERSLSLEQKEALQLHDFKRKVASRPIGTEIIMSHLAPLSIGANVSGYVANKWKGDGTAKFNEVNSNLARQVSTELGIENPVGAFLIDVVTDPTTYLGATSAAKLLMQPNAVPNMAKTIIQGSKQLPKKGMELIDDAVRLGKNVGKKTDDVLKQLSGSGKFKSEIDWGKWNKEIPNNKVLMEEYNSIEETAKANGTWMKNPDGTDFPGLPEQFVQQNSKNFKKAFGNTQVLVNGRPQILTHNSPDRFTEFNLDKISNGRLSGDGIYTFEENKMWNGIPEHLKKHVRYPAKTNQIKYGNIEYNLYGNSTNPRIGKGQFDDITKDEIIDGYTSTKVVDNINGKNIHVFPNPRQLKSAIGNNGMFDMTNPNIYKGIIPPAVLFYLQSQQNNKKEE